MLAKSRAPDWVSETTAHLACRKGGTIKKPDAGNAAV